MSERNEANELSPSSVNHAGGIHPLDQLEWEAEDDYTRNDAYVGRMQEIDMMDEADEYDNLCRHVEAPASEGGWGMSLDEYNAMWARSLAYANQISLDKVR
jgi:hypothetical protein